MDIYNYLSNITNMYFIIKITLIITIFSNELQFYTAHFSLNVVFNKRTKPRLIKRILCMETIFIMQALPIITCRYILAIMSQWFSCNRIISKVSKAFQLVCVHKLHCQDKINPWPKANIYTALSVPPSSIFIQFRLSKSRRQLNEFFNVQLLYHTGHIAPLLQNLLGILVYQKILWNSIIKHYGKNVE